MSFNDIFKSSFLENVSEFSVLDTVIGLAVCAGDRPVHLPHLQKDADRASCTPAALR